MKKIILHIIFIFFSLCCISEFCDAQSDFKSQEELKKRANDFFEKEDYSTALPLYSQLVSLFSKDPDYNYRFGVCLIYADRRENEKPIRYLEFAASKPGVDVAVFYYLGLAYHDNYRFTEAIREYNLYKEKATEKNVAKLDVDRQIEICKNAKELLSHFYDLYVLEKTDVTYKDFFRSYNTDRSAGKLLVKPDVFKTAIDKRREKISLMYFSKENKIAYFSSYGSNGKNGKDIYCVHMLADGSWGKPEPLGTAINTQYDEDFPFLGSDGTLYFSSKGHNTMGGYDIFSSKQNSDGSWSTPKNMNYPINTPFDDIMFVPDTSGEYAYFSSFRSSTENMITVYKIRIDKRPAIDQTLVLDKPSDTTSANATAYSKTLQYLKEKEALEVNASENMFADKEDKTSNNAAVENNTAIEDDNKIPDNISNDDILKMADKQAMDAQKEYAELRNQKETAKKIAQDKKSQADEKYKEAETISSNAANISDNSKKQSELNKATKLRSDADQLNKESVVASKISEQLDEQIANKQKEAEGATQYAKEIKTAVQSNSADSSIALLTKMIDKMQNSPSDVNYIVTNNPNKEFIKSKEEEAEKYTEQAKQLQEEINSIKSQADGYRKDAEDSKKKSVKEQNIQNAKDLDVEAQTKQKEADQILQKSEKIQADIDSAKAQSAIYSSIAGDIKSNSAAIAYSKPQSTTNTTTQTSTTSKNNNGLTPTAQKKNEIISSIDDILKKAQDEADALKKQSDNAYAYANDKNKQSVDKLKQSGNLLESSNDITNDDQKEKAVSKAKELKNESTAMAQQSVILYSIAQNLEDAYKDKLKEIADIKAKTNEIKQLAESNKLTEAQNTLAKLKDNPESAVTAESVNKKYQSEIKDGLAAKENELEKVAAKEKQIQSMADSLTEVSKALKQKADNTKDPNKKNELIKQSEQLSALASDKQKEADDAKENANKLEVEVGALRIKAHFVTTLIDETKNYTSDNPTAVVDKADLKKKVEEYQNNNIFAETQPKTNAEKNNKNAVSDNTVKTNNNANNTTVVSGNAVDNNNPSTNKTTTTTVENNNVNNNNKAAVGNSLAANTKTDNNANNTTIVNGNVVDNNNPSTNKTTTTTVENNNVNNNKNAVSDNTVKTNDNANNTTVVSDNTANNNNNPSINKTTATTVENNNVNNKAVVGNPIAANTSSSTKNVQTSNPIKYNSYSEFNSGEKKEAVADIIDKTIVSLNNNITSLQADLTTEKDPSNKQKINKEITALQAEVAELNKESAKKHNEAKVLNGSKDVVTSKVISDTVLANNLAAEAADDKNKAVQKFTEANNSKDPVVKDNLRKEAEALDKTANEKQLEALKINDLSKSNAYYDNQTQIDNLKKAADENNPQVTTANLLESESKYYFEKAKSLTRTINDSMSIAQKKNIYDNASAQEQTALQKQSKALEIYNKLAPEYANNTTTTNNNTSGNNNSTANKTTANNVSNKTTIGTTIAANTTTANNTTTTVVSNNNTDNNNPSANKSTTTTDNNNLNNKSTTANSVTDNNKTTTTSKGNNVNTTTVVSNNATDNNNPAVNKSTTTADNNNLNNKSTTANSITDNTKTTTTSKGNNVNTTTVVSNNATDNNNPEVNKSTTTADNNNLNNKSTTANSVTDNTKTTTTATGNNANNTTVVSNNATTANNNPAVNKSTTTADNNNLNNKSTTANTVTDNTKTTTTATGNNANNTTVVSSNATTANNNPAVNKSTTTVDNNNLDNKSTVGNSVTDNTTTTTGNTTTSGTHSTNNNEFSNATNPNAIPQNSTPQNGISYKVQIAAVRKHVDHSIFRGINPVTEETTSTGLVRYLTGNFNKYEDANASKKHVRTIGYPDAFIVAYRNGERISDAKTISPATNVASNNEPKVIIETNIKPNVPTSNGLSNPISNIKGLFYSVQVGVYVRPVTSAQLFNITPLYDEFMTNGYYRYISGTYENVQDAVAAKNSIVKRGVTDAFVVVYYNGKKISMTEAKTLSPGYTISSENTPAIKIVTSQPDNAIQKNTTSPSAEIPGLIYKVQLGAYKNEVPVDVVNDMFDAISEYKLEHEKTTDSMTVYISGSFKDYKSASDYKNAVIEKGVKDAFVIAYYYGKKISVAEAKSMQAGSNVVSTTNVGTTSNTNTSAINSNNNAATQTTNINKANTNNTAINNTSNTTKVNTTETNPVTVVKRIEKDTTSNNLKNNHVVSTTDTAKAHVTEIKPNNIAAQTNDNKPKDTTSSNLKNNHAASVVDTAKTNTTEIKPANVAVQNKIKDTTINNLTKNHAVDTVKARVTEIKPNTDNKKTTDTINNNQLSSSNVKPNNISTDQNTTISTNNTDTTNHASNNEIKNFHIIASFYTNEQDAKNDVEILKSKGFKDAEVIKSVSNHGYYVSYKAYSSNKEAQYDLSVIKHLVNPLAWIYEKNEQ